MTIQEIIQDCKKHDRKAQKLLYERYLSKFYRLALRYLGNVEDAEDCVSEGFVKIFESIKTFDYQEINSFEVWMKRIIINQSLMLIRKRNNFKLIDLDEAFDVGEIMDFESNIDAQQILKLPDGYRTVFNLYAIEGYSHDEISKTLNISENTSKSQLHKARKLLQEWLKNGLRITK
jgi:RNA polymerase sigma factor (sigma-70 family)